jgi:hypothetical protein
MLSSLGCYEGQMETHAEVGAGMTWQEGNKEGMGRLKILYLLSIQSG